MDDDLGKGFSVKKQDDLIDKDWNFMQWRTQKTTSVLKNNKDLSDNVKAEFE